MDILKKIFPLSWKFTGSVANLVIGVLIHLLIGIIGAFIPFVLGMAIGAVSGWFGGKVDIALVGIIPLPLLGTILSLIGALIDLYVVGGIVIMFLAHFKVLKD